MTPHRRRCLIRALLEIRGALADVTAESLLAMPPANLLALYDEVAESFDAANITEPMSNIEAAETIVMPAVVEPPPKKR